MASIQPRTWVDKEGKQRTSYRVQIRRRGFPPVTQTFERRTDAARWARETEADIQRGLRFPQHEAERHTLADLVERQLEYVKLHRPHDYERQRAMLEWWKGKIGALTLAAISIKPAVLADTRDALLTDEELSPATVNRYLAALSKAFTNAVQEWHWLRDNPLRNISKPEEPRGRVRYLDDEERGRLLKACRTSAYRPLYLMVLFAITTGMRRGELTGLRWQDIDLERGVAVLQNTKNGDRRSVPILPEVAELLREHGKVRRLDSDLIFLSGGSAEVWLFDRAWYAALKEAKVKDFRFHDLRHTAASYLAMSGATTAEIAAVLGHRTLQMVKRYAHLSDQHTGAVVERMARKYFGRREANG
jgi:integrase